MTFIETYNFLRDFSTLVCFRWVHYSLIAVQLREECHTKMVGKMWSRCAIYNEPFNLWLSNMLVIYAGDVLANLIMCKTPLEFLCNWQELFLCTLVWYLMYFSPFDIVYIITRTSTYHILAIFVTSVSLVFNVDKAVQNVAKKYEETWLPMLLIGGIVGSGGELLKPIMSFIINQCNCNNAACIKLSVNSKIALMVSFCYALRITHTNVFTTKYEDVQVYLVGFLLLYRYLALISPIDHYLWLLETKLCYTIFGGWFIDMLKLWEQSATTNSK